MLSTRELACRGMIGESNLPVSRRSRRTARGLGARGRRGDAPAGGLHGTAGRSWGTAGRAGRPGRCAARRPTADAADLPPSALSVLAGQPGGAGDGPGSLRRPGLGPCRSPPAATADGRVDARRISGRPWRTCRGWRCVLDPGGAEARRFGVATSGHVLLYDTRGDLIFSGGITPGRGEQGDNAGPGGVARPDHGRGRGAARRIRSSAVRWRRPDRPRTRDGSTMSIAIGNPDRPGAAGRRPGG